MGRELFPDEAFPDPQHLFVLLFIEGRSLVHHQEFFIFQERTPQLIGAVGVFSQLVLKGEPHNHLPSEKASHSLLENCQSPSCGLDKLLALDLKILLSLESTVILFQLPHFLGEEFVHLGVRKVFRVGKESVFEHLFPSSFLDDGFMALIGLLLSAEALLEAASLRLSEREGICSEDV